MRFLNRHKGRAVTALAFVVFSLLDFTLDLWAQVSWGELEMVSLLPASPLKIAGAATDDDSTPATFQDEDCFCSTSYLIRERCLFRPGFLYAFPLGFFSTEKALTVDLVPPHHPPRD